MTLEAVKLAAEAKRTAEQEYRTAVLAAARDNGVSAISRAAGVTRQAVRQLLLRANGDAPPGALARLEDFDKRYDQVIVYRAGAFPPKDGAAITRYRNGRAKIRAKKGLPKAETVKNEAYRHAEDQVLALLRAGLPVETPAATVTPAELDFALSLRERLEAKTDGIPF